MANDKFERIEKKFWMDAQQFAQMSQVLDEHMIVDQYGHSVIRNIYCDSDDYRLIRRSLEQPAFKEKLRIRSYSGFAPGTKAFIEIKRKVTGVGYKRRIQIPVEQIDALMAGQMVGSENPQIEKELHEFIKRYQPKPKVYLTYERVAMTAKDDPELRITIDRNIRYKMYSKDFDFSQEGDPVIEDESRALMEVKAPGYMPSWLIHEMSRLHIYHSSFSKIGTCFTKFVAPNLDFGGNARPTPIRNIQPMQKAVHIILPKTVNL